MPQRALGSGGQATSSASSLRHASTKLTADTYGEWLPMGNKAAVDRLHDAMPRAIGSNVAAGLGRCGGSR
jgi:hypothetical protein